MKNKGFVFIETIIVVVILTTSLLAIYSTFSKMVQSQKSRIYYDDIVYIYRTGIIKNKLEKMFNNGLVYNIDSPYIGSESSDFNEQYLDLYNHLYNDYEVEYFLLLEVSNNKVVINEILEDDMKTYLKTLSIKDSVENILVVKYENCNTDICKNFYSWIEV